MIDYGKMAEELLPCCGRYESCFMSKGTHHHSRCPAHYREAVALWGQEQYQEGVANQRESQTKETCQRGHAKAVQNGPSDCAWCQSLRELLEKE